MIEKLSCFFFRQRINFYSTLLVVILNIPKKLLKIDVLKGFNYWRSSNLQAD